MAEVLVTYRDPESARRAIRSLESRGVDAARIHLTQAPGAHVAKTDAAMREPDMAVTRNVGRRGLGTAAVASVVLAAIGGAIGWFASGGDQTGAAIGAMGGFCAGGTLGFFYGGASALAVSEEWGDTFETTGETTLTLTVEDEHVVDLRDHIDATDPERVLVT
jgi:hypothetical protein